uniref:Uncharacterized protein n=1 Tax=Clastoptera arizonana TaxID=38151 RepID=A0A1B6EBS2_9HEMI
MKNCVLIVVLTTCVILTSTLHVRDWGMTSDLVRLKFSIQDVFKEAYHLIIAGRDGVLPLPDFKQQYEQQWRNITEIVEFSAFNGWMKDTRLQMVKGSEHGILRRYKLQPEDKRGVLYFMKEMIVCAQCLEIKSMNVNYFYEALFNKHHVTGKIMNGPINYKISFQMTVTNDYLPDLQQYYCYTQTDAFDVELDSTNNIFDSDIEGLRTLNFLAERVDEWMENHFNTTIKTKLKNQLQMSLAKIMNKHQICDEFLSGGN